MSFKVNEIVLFFVYLLHKHRNCLNTLVVEIVHARTSMLILQLIWFVCYK
jgi:hypothetical protein